MEQSKEKVFNVFKGIFGDISNLTDDQVIQKISDWLSQYAGIDPHNLGILKMFFGMQTDFTNTLDAFVNCQTYWGGDLTTPDSSHDLSGFSGTLRSKVDSYISSLSGSQKTDAESLESKWFSEAPRYDKVGGKWTGELVGTDKDFTINTSGSWVEFFCDKLDKYNSDEIARVFSANIMNRSAEIKYKRDKANYEAKKDDLRQEDIALQKLEANHRAKARSAFKKLLGRKSKTSQAGRIKGISRYHAPVRGAAVSAKGAPHAAVHPKPPVVSAPSVKKAQSGALAAGLARRNAQAAAAPRVNTSVAAHAASQPVKAKKHPKDEQKVV
jgi:hypothetical protein